MAANLASKLLTAYSFVHIGCCPCEPTGCEHQCLAADLSRRRIFSLPEKHWMGRSQQAREERASVDNSRAGVCGGYSPRPTLVLDEEPVEKHGSEVTHTS